MEKLWTMGEVAQCLGINDIDVEELVRQGKLTCYRLGGQFLRFRPAQVEALKGKIRFRPNGWIALRLARNTHTRCLPPRALVAKSHRMAAQTPQFPYHSDSKTDCLAFFPVGLEGTGERATGLAKANLRHDGKS